MIEQQQPLSCPKFHCSSRFLGQKNLYVSCWMGRHRIELVKSAEPMLNYQKPQQNTGIPFKAVILNWPIVYFVHGSRSNKLKNKGTKNKIKTCTQPLLFFTFSFQGLCCCLTADPPPRYDINLYYLRVVGVQDVVVAAIWSLGGLGEVVDHRGDFLRVQILDVLG